MLFVSGGLTDEQAKEIDNYYKALPQSVIRMSGNVKIEWLCKVFVFKHRGYYLGGFTVVIAKDIDEAMTILKDKLTSETSLPLNDIELLAELDPNTPQGFIVWDGNY